MTQWINGVDLDRGNVNVNMVAWLVGLVTREYLDYKMVNSLMLIFS